MSEFKKVNTVDPAEVQQAETTEVHNIFTREPEVITCKYCNKKILTDTENESTWTGILLSLLLFVVFKIIAVPLIVLIIPLTQQTIHKCPYCLNKVGVCSFYDMIALKDKVISFKIGSLGIIISRKQLLGIFVFVLLCILVQYFISNINFTRGNFIPDKWEDFNKICNREMFEKKQEQSRILCQKYKYMDVQWSGYILRVDYIENFFARYKISILVKMNVGDLEEHSEEGDLYLKLDENYYNKYKHLVFNMTRGDYIHYNATVLEEGSQGAYILEGFGIALADNQDKKKEYRAYRPKSACTSWRKILNGS